VEIVEQHPFDQLVIQIYFVFPKKVITTNVSFVIIVRFCLDLWEVLKEYPAVRVKLEAIAVKRLEKHKKPLIQQGKNRDFYRNFLSF